MSDRSLIFFPEVIDGLTVGHARCNVHRRTTIDGTYLNGERIICLEHPEYWTCQQYNTDGRSYLFASGDGRNLLGSIEYMGGGTYVARVAVGFSSTDIAHGRDVACFAALVRHFVNVASAKAAA
jgi:hypothetical protein